MRIAGNNLHINLSFTTGSKFNLICTLKGYLLKVLSRNILRLKVEGRL